MARLVSISYGCGANDLIGCLCPSLFIYRVRAPGGHKYYSFNASMVLWLIECRWMRVYPTDCRGRRQVVTALSILRNPPRSSTTYEFIKM